jgi:type VI protein secretion system component VasF
MMIKGNAFNTNHEPPGRNGEINHSQATHNTIKSTIAALAINTYLSFFSNLLSMVYRLP